MTGCFDVAGTDHVDDPGVRGFRDVIKLRQDICHLSWGSGLPRPENKNTLDFYYIAAHIRSMATVMVLQRLLAGRQVSIYGTTNTPVLYFWVTTGFQCQSRQSYSHLAEAYVTVVSRNPSHATPANHLVAGTVTSRGEFVLN